MTLIYRQLCKRNAHWYLLSWDTEQRQGSIIVGKAMPREVGDFVSADPTHDGTKLLSFQDVIYYPEIRYRGFRVYPQAWHSESSEPLLHCYMDHSDISADGWDATKERMRELIEDGWQWDQRDGGNKYVHVDELEKIEGPPPAPGGGAF